MLGAWAHWCYQDHLEEAAFGANDRFPVAVLLQHFNLGYFLYDTVHVAVWDQKFMEHHLIAIAGYATSELANVFGLANAVNTWITEVGSLMYSAYLIKRSDTLYLAFVICYTLSRVYFGYWSLVVLSQVWEVLQNGPGTRVMPSWAPYCAASLQILLFGVNATFVATHWRKLLKRSQGKGTVTGLLEDVQFLRQRLDVLDQRRNEPVKETEKRFTELTAQVQAIEHQGRMAQSALDESQRRQVARQRRWEQSLEELQTRVATELAHRSGSRSNLRVEGAEHAESRFRKLEQRQEFSETTLAALQMQVEEGLRAARHREGGHEVQEVSERGLMALERKTSGQIQDLSSAVANLRVRVDGQLQRMSAMAERFENPNPSGQVVQLRNEVQQRSQDQQRCEAEMAVLRSKMQDFAESCDDSIADLREAWVATNHQSGEVFDQLRRDIRVFWPFLPFAVAMPEPTRLVCGHLDMSSGEKQMASAIKVRLPKLGTMLEEPALGMSENVRTLFQTCQFFDVCLVVKEQRFPAHLAVLASLSEAFGSFLKDALSTDSATGRPPLAPFAASAEELPRIALEIEEPKAVLVLLDWAYQMNGSFELSLQELRDVLRLTQRLALPLLIERVVDPVAQQVTHANILEILAISVEFDLVGLYNHAFKILVLSGYLKEMSKSTGILQYPKLMQHMLLHWAASEMAL
eukprot:symbB.v1.2.030577.t1/scaffold3461.1/size67752/2